MFANESTWVVDVRRTFYNDIYIVSFNFHECEARLATVDQRPSKYIKTQTSRNARNTSGLLKTDGGAEGESQERNPKLFP